MTFDEWLSEQEGFACRAERLYDDFPEVKDLEKLRKWLEAAYKIGVNSLASSLVEDNIGEWVEIHVSRLDEVVAEICGETNDI